MKKFFIWLFSLLIIAVIGIGGYAWWTTHGAISRMHQDSSIQTKDKADNLTGKKRPIALLLLGTDTGALGRDYKGRTDSMMIAVINPRQKKRLL
ncbi:hypothetical protein Q757_06995 [Oenococcus alcoholitolerans]|uniref:Cell envelope-related transcriptional attenuator domain-containing protein n=1 Tax=Oenococcus alcoholitolerans TaxID=931074 RepID=A0ABR4XPU2_9LACO|nr:hypothetical protein Q757_06995 [Oenococcus alcoholitolerans]